MTSITGFKTYDFFYPRATTHTGPADQQLSAGIRTVGLFQPGVPAELAPPAGRCGLPARASTAKKWMPPSTTSTARIQLCRALVKTEVGVANDPAAFTWAPGTTVTGCSDPTLRGLVWGFCHRSGHHPRQTSPSGSMNKGDYAGWGRLCGWHLVRHRPAGFDARRTPTPTTARSSSTSVLDSDGRARQ